MIACVLAVAANRIIRLVCQLSVTRGRVTAHYWSYPDYPVHPCKTNNTKNSIEENHK